MLGTGSHGFSLVEVAIAVAIFAFTFVMLISLLGAGMGSNQKSSQQTVATNILVSIVADLRSTPNFSKTSTSPVYGILLTAQTAMPSSSNSPLTGSGVTTSYLFFDNNQNALETSPLTTPPTPPPSGAVYQATTYLSPVTYVGPATASSPLSQTTWMARVVVSWPAQAAQATPPVGNVEAVTEFRLH